MPGVSVGSLALTEVGAGSLNPVDFTVTEPASGNAVGVALTGGIVRVGCVSTTGVFGTRPSAVLAILAMIEAGMVMVVAGTVPAAGVVTVAVVVARTGSPASK